MKLLLVIPLLISVSCGKKSVTKYIEVDNTDIENRLKDMIDANNSNLQSQIDDMLIRIGNLETKKEVALVDPCPEINASFKEKLLRTSDGELIAYFEQGSRRFLSTLSAGNYRTTDSRACNFTVTCDETGCNVTE
jgi:hypothetical protein